MKIGIAHDFEKDDVDAWEALVQVFPDAEYTS